MRITANLFSKPVRLMNKALGAVALCALLAVPTVDAQTSKGSLAGVVRDSSGAVVPGAAVTVTNENTGEKREVVAGGNGSFRADAINPGRYGLHVVSPGFATLDVNGINVTPSVITTYDVNLNVGSTQLSVSVEANTNTINTENAQLAGNIDATQLSKVPIFTLNPAELASTLPGVTREYSTVVNLGGVGGNGTVKLTSNGARPRANNFMIDSQDANDISLGGEALSPILPDMFQSVTVLLNDASAEFGRAGGAVINQITRSGTNHFHGSVHEIYTGSGLDALDGQTRRVKPLAAGAANPKARYNQHQYGFTLGGPILRDKLFGFGGATFVRYYGNTQPAGVELPDAAGYATLQSIATAGNAQAAALLPYLNNGGYLTTFNVLQTGTESVPISSRPGCSGGCNVTTAVFQRKSTPQQAPETQWMYQIDFTPRPADTFSVHYLHDRGNTNPYFGLNPTSLPGFDAQVGGPTEFGGGNWVHIFTPSLLNEFRASEVRLNFQFGPTAETLANPTAKLYNISFGGLSVPTLGVSQNMPQGRVEGLYQFQDTATYVRGRQSFRIGADLGRLIETDLIAQNALGSESFTAGGGLSSIDNYLSNRLGTSGSASRTFGPTRTDPHLWKVAAFAQDDVKLTSEFTFNLGVRYDYLTNPLNTLSYPAIDMNNPFQAINTYVPVNADKNNIAPRIGFAWVPHYGFLSDGKTVVHGGFGVFYDPFFTNILVNSAQSSPVAPSTTLQSTATGGLTGASGLIAGISPGFSATSAVQSAANNLVNPLTYQYNFGFERELPFQLKTTINYVRTRGEKLYSNRQLNYFVGATRINPSRGVINIRDNRGDSDYNALQVQVERKFSKGLFFNASYAYGKLLDTASEVFATFSSPTSYSANLAGDGLRQDWGPSAFDRRHVASFTYAYTPIGFHSNSFIADKLLSTFTRHFTISGQTQFYSGVYTTYNVSGRDINGDGSASNDRPVLSNVSAPITNVGVDGSFIGGTSGVYYDYAAYNASPSNARVRNPVQASSMHFLVPNTALGGALVSQEVSRNSFQNPGQQYWNVALEKAFPTPLPHVENGCFVFRVEAQQLGNHNNITYFSNNVTQVGLTAFQNVSNARETNNQHLRLWAKYEF